jgi:hypothetical protein
VDKKKKSKKREKRLSLLIWYCNRAYLFDATFLLSH